MIEFDRELGELEIWCDTCGYCDTIFAGDFRDAIEEAKERGWKIVRVAGGWKHTCSECNHNIST